MIRIKSVRRISADFKDAGLVIDVVLAGGINGVDVLIADDYVGEDVVGGCYRY